MFRLMPTRARVYLWGYTTDHYSLECPLTVIRLSDPLATRATGELSGVWPWPSVVDHQLERCWLLDRKVPWFRSLVRRTYRLAAEYNDAVEPIAHDFALRSLDGLVGTGQH